ncbi:hypothetical protein ACIA8G_19455 [Lentzea sp. NPDC051213]|uniref:hypothetical protein n=1 Tax=Lentzea sp. NPDC051213 TaxID=3364126 RepID=UPI0037915A16
MANGSGDGLVGDLVLHLAEEGRLSLEPAHAGDIVDDLVRTLASVTLLLRTAETSHADCAAEWLLPGNGTASPEWNHEALEAARRELPKYIEAFRIIRDRSR